MEGNIIRLGIALVGIILIIVSVRMNSVKKLAVNHAVVWGLVGVLMILVGAIPVFSSWTELLAPGTSLVFFAVVILILFVEIQNSAAISRLTIKNRELAMQVALLNQESEHMMEALDEIKLEEEDSYEKDTVRG